MVEKWQQRAAVVHDSSAAHGGAVKTVGGKGALQFILLRDAV
jgi:hypothetical protein